MADTSQPTCLEIARAYVARGLKPVPIPYREKGCFIDGWRHLSLTEQDLPRYFNDGQQNIGILLGEPSGNLVDVDLDCSESVDLAPEFLPPTAAVFGRSGKRSSHYLYVSPGAPTRKHVDPIVNSEETKEKTLVELRSTGGQTVFPGSTHKETGEPIVWESDGDTAFVPSQVLQDCVERLAIASLLMRHKWARKDAIGAANGAAEPLARLASNTPLLAKLEGAPIDKLFKKLLGIPEKKKDRSAKSTDEDDGESIFKTAVRAYNEAHPGNWPKSGGTCPACDHHGCFGALPENPERWCCFSASHIKPGVPGNEGAIHHGDALDMAAYLANKTPIELLQDSGLLVQDTRDRIPFETHNLYLAVDAAEKALAKNARIYQRGGKIVYAVGAKADDEGLHHAAPVIHEYNTASLLHPVSQSMVFTHYDGRKKKRVECAPPKDVINILHHLRIRPNIRALEGVTTSPVLRPDGSVLDNPGYDPATQLLYIPSGEVAEIPDHPTPEQAAQGAADLLEVFEDFPFASEVDEAATLAAVLTLVGRPAFEQAPMFMVDASTPGTGKGLLVNTIATIGTGFKPPSSPYVADNEEMSKQITAHALAGDSVVLIDNVTGGARVGWTCLDAALTSGEWAGRVLGKSEQPTLPMKIVWFVTGNNLSTQGDAARRTLRIALDSQTPNPERRSGFHHPDLLAWVRQERGRLVAAALTMLRGYFEANCPRDAALAPYGSFETWSNVVRGCLLWLGLPDPCAAVASDNEDLDPEEEGIKCFIKAWSEATQEPTSAAHLLELAGNRLKYGDLHDAILEICPGRDGQLPPAKALGYKLNAVRGRIREIEGSYIKIMKHRKCGARAGSLWVLSKK